MSDNERIISDNLGLVHSCAKRFKGRGIEYDDLFQAGCLGLVKAAENYDVTLGFRFSTYAVPVILGEIRRLFRDGGAVRISRGLKELSLRVSRASESFALSNGREPTVSELAAYLGITVGQTIEAINALRRPLSLTQGDDEAQTDVPVDAPDERITERLALYCELDRLSKTDRELIELRYFRSMTQTKTAAILGMTQVQVSRREKKLLTLLRSRLTA